jgi:hypothetical protein
MAKMHSGGGRTPVQKSTRTGSPAHGINVKHVAQIGTAIDQKAIEPRRAPMPAGGNIKLGNEVSLNVGRGGPGAGRTVHASGSQRQHGPVNRGSTSPARDILGAFGPERSRG